MKDQGKVENKWLLGMINKGSGDPEKNPPEVKSAESQEEEGEAEAEGADESSNPPEWLDVVMGALGLDGPDGIRKVSDKDLLEVKGIGKATLEEIRKMYPFKKAKPSGDVIVRIKPMRGIGGYGQAGWEGPMEAELAEQYEKDGYLEILE